MGKQHLPTMVMINVSNTFEFKEQIKKLGGQWCEDSKRWWIEKSKYEAIMNIIQPNAVKPKKGRQKKNV